MVGDLGSVTGWKTAPTFEWTLNSEAGTLKASRGSRQNLSRVNQSSAEFILNLVSNSPRLVCVGENVLPMSLEHPYIQCSPMSLEHPYTLLGEEQSNLAWLPFRQGLYLRQFFILLKPEGSWTYWFPSGTILLLQGSLLSGFRAWLHLGCMLGWHTAFRV